jgi:hypothetical protein
LGPLGRKIHRIIHGSGPSQHAVHSGRSPFNNIPFEPSSESTQAPLETDGNDFVGGDFKKLTRALCDLTQLHPSLPDTIATMTLFERDLNDYHSLFSLSLNKACDFIARFIPDPDEWSNWKNYATAILSGTPQAVKPPLPTRRGHVCVCAVCGRSAEEPDYEASGRTFSGGEDTRYFSRLSGNSLVRDRNNNSQEAWGDSPVRCQGDSQPRQNAEANTEHITTQYYEERPRTLDLFGSIPEFRDNTSSG